MVKNIYLLLIAIALLTSCCKKFSDLTMKKTPYFGDELRIDGYYYSNMDSGWGTGVAVFYRDGFCIHMFTDPKSSDTLSYIENEFLLNKSFISKIKQKPSWIGVFQINKGSIEFETWEAAGKYITTYSHYGKIINDTTFTVNKRRNNDQNRTSSLNLIYRFKQFNPKPDSTNVYVK